MSEIKDLIRELLREELSRMGGSLDGVPRPQITEEAVSIRSSIDLNAFASRVIEMAQDGRKRADILAGKHVFRLDTGLGSATPTMASSQQVHAHVPSAPPLVSTKQAKFTTGMVTERDVNALPEGTSTVTASKSVRLTPLAKDELRRRRIKLERTTT